MSDYVPETDLPLFGGPSRHNLRSTSLAAYRAADHRGNRAKCLAYLRHCGDTGATGDEIAEATGVLTQSVPSAMGQLRRAGLIRESGKTRPTRTGCKAMVYVATEAV